jgi:hypothetical protein
MRGTKVTECFTEFETFALKLFETPRIADVRLLNTRLNEYHTRLMVFTSVFMKTSISGI